MRCSPLKDLLFFTRRPRLKPLPFFLQCLLVYLSTPIPWSKINVSISKGLLATTLTLTSLALEQPVTAMESMSEANERPNLWELAYEQGEFDEEGIRVLAQSSKEHSSSWSPMVLLEQVKTLSSARFVECKQSGWLTGPRGDNFAVIHQVQTIVSAVLELNEMVSAGLRFDASGYGATAWSIITFGLEVCLDLLWVSDP